MFFYIALIAWLGGVVVSFANGDRRLPSIILLVGIALVVLKFMGKQAISVWRESPSWRQSSGLLTKQT